eukprot:GHVQ01020915.1.p1 GENE.GHVQ01020915.1~~GHVQ01020915.1.p1  ORF type:complete len:173 (+),score=22.71 GHVQ01020915.1:161-679(+)
MGELKMTGNCLLHSRPLFTFNQPFSDLIHLKLLKELLIQSFGTPRNHPLTKPFHDHVMSFFWHDEKVWFRHYQISPKTDDDANIPDRQLLTEIGPRFVLDPIKIFEESFGGKTLWQNPFYLSPAQVRSSVRHAEAQKYISRVDQESKRRDHVDRTKLADSLVCDENVFGDPH